MATASRSILPALLEPRRECLPSPDLAVGQMSTRAISFQDMPSTLLHGCLDGNASIRVLDANTKISEHLR